MKTNFKTRIIPLFLCLFFAISMFTIPAQAVSQGTDGNELQVLEASELEIQLGTAWAGVGFVFRTDAGVYPGPVYVGNDGVLRLEIGGSKQYILSCLQSDITIPEPVLIQMQALATQGDQVDITTSSNNEVSTETENTIAGIPVFHIVLFGGGIVLSVGTLITLYVLGKRRPNENDDDEYDGEDDE